MIKQFVKDSFIYTFSTILGRGINIFLLPIYTRYLTPNEYGIIEILAITFTLLSLILPLEISQALARFLPDPKNKTYKNSYSSIAFWFTAFVFGFTIILVFIAPAFTSKVLLNDENLILIIKLASVAMFLSALKDLMINQLRINLQSMASALTSIMYGLTMALISILLIVKYNYGIHGYIYSQITASALALIMGIFFSRITLPITHQLDFIKLKEMLAFSAPLVLSSAAVYVYIFMDRWMLRYWLGLEEVGIYGVSYRVAALLGLVLIPFQMALTPIIYRQYKEKNTPLAINQILRYFLIFTIPLLALLSIFAEEIVWILAGPNFQMAAKQVSLLSLATVLMFVYNFAPGLGIAKKTKIIATINILTSIVNITLNYLLIPTYGKMGAASATFFAALFSLFLYFPISNKYYKIPYSIKQYLLVFLILLIILLVCYLLPTSFIYRVAFWFFLSISTTLILADKNDFQHIQRLFKKI